MAERVLVVDDEEIVLNAVRKALRQDDLEIETVQSATDALSLLASRSYALVITDLMLPGMDGLELLQRVRVMELPPQTIMITGFPTIRSALAARRLGAFEYVTKPFTRAELRSVVVRALRTNPAGARTGSWAVSAEPAWHIPDHAWARPDPDGTVRIGIAGQFARTAGEIQAVRLPAVGDLVEQGRVCVLLHAADMVEHSVYCPLSGRVLEANQAVVERPGLIQSSPESEGWLFRLAPLHFEQEIPNLVRF